MPRLRKNPTRLPILVSHSPSSSTPCRSLHDSPSNPNPPDPLPSRFLQPIPSDHAAAEPREDSEMNEFLSRFVWSIRGKISEAYPDLSSDTRDAMLLIICQKVVARLDSGGSVSGDGDPAIDLSEDLWNTIWDVSAAVTEAMRRDRVRSELRKYLHCDEVKRMCRFAEEAGIRGDFLRELRFKWAREKLEEVDFYRGLELMRVQIKKNEETEKGLIAASEQPMITELPQRKGEIKYKIYGIDMSDPKWAEVSQRLEEAEKRIVPEEAQPVVGRSKRVEDKIMGLDPEKDDLEPAFKEFEEALSAKRVDWLALLGRIKDHNEDLYFKAAELLLDEQTFDPNIRDYSKLMDAHSNAGRVKDAERILNKMLEKGIEPDVLTSVILVHMYSKIGNYNGAKEAFDKLRREGFQPDLRAYNSLITAYVNAGIPKQAVALIREMEEQDVKPTRDMYMQVLRAFSRSGQVDGAQKIIHAMQFAGVQLDLESYRLLIEAYSLAGEPEQARGHFDSMMRAGLSPDDSCVASVVGGYAKKNLLDKALELLLKLEKEGFVPGIATNSVLVDWMGRLQLVDEVEVLLRRMEEAGELPLEVHESICDMYSRARDELKALRSLKILEERKSLLNGNQFERIVNGLLLGGFLNDARRMLDVMQAQGFTPSEPLRVRIAAAQSIPRPDQGSEGRSQEGRTADRIKRG